MRSSKAFTLVELLVVIAIISLLVSILAPSLNVAKDIAKQVVCSSNIASAGKSIHLYVESNDDKMPPYRNAWKNGAPSTYYMTSAETCFWLSKVGDVDGITLAQRWRGVGMVYGTGYIENPELFYCPGQVYDWFIRRSYEDPQQKKRYGSYSSITSMVRTGFLWNAWGNKYNTADAGGSDTWDMAFRTLSSMDTDKPLGMDHGIFPWTLQVHTAQGVSRPTFNVMFNDAHVEPYTPGTIFVENLLVNWGGGSGGVLKNWAENAGPNNDWADAWGILIGT